MSLHNSDLADLLPLTPTVFHIILALSDGPRHGYWLMQEVNRRSEGLVGLGPGTLYGAIQRMEDRGLIAEARPPEGETAEGRRRYYGVTDLGRGALLAETERLERLVEQVRAKGLDSRTGATS